MTDRERAKRGGCFRNILIGVGIFALVLVALGVGGSVYTNRAEQAFFADNPAAGTLVDIGGRNLHLYCIGEGSPTVVLDAGQGGWSTDFAPLQQALAERTRVCTYDRAGYGWSYPATDERTVEQITEDLRTLLATAEVQPPYVLVTFSFSGLVGRHYAAQYPEELAGLVLIDPAHENDPEILPEEIRNAQQSVVGMYQLFEGAASVGLVRLLDPASMAPSAPFIATDPVNPEVYYEFVAHPSWWAVSRQEFMTNLNGNLPQLATSFPFPVRIIGLVPPSGDNEAMAQINQAHLDLLGTLAEGDEQAELVVFEDIAHEDIVKETALVSGVIEALLDDITNNQPT